MLNKKSIELSLTVVIIAFILLVTAAILLAIFKGLIGKEQTQAHGLIADSDKDNIMDMADKCPCTAGFPEYGGCPSAEMLKEYEEATDKSTYRACLT